MGGSFFFIAARPESKEDNLSGLESEDDIATGAMRNTIFSTGTRSEDDMLSPPSIDMMNASLTRSEVIKPGPRSWS